MNVLCQQLPETATLISSPWLKHNPTLKDTVGSWEEGPECLYLAAGVAAVPDKAPNQEPLTFYL